MTAHSEASPLLHHGTSPAPYIHGSSSSSSSSTPQHPSHSVRSNAADQRHQETRGLIYMTLSALFFSFMSLLVSLTAKSLPSFEIVLFRGIIQTLMGVLACRYLNISPLGNPGVRFLLFCRGLAGSCGLGFFFYALSVMPLADATVIFFLGPVFTAILARIVLKEAFGPLDALASAVSLVGVVLVAQPSVLFRHDQPKVPGGGEGQEEELMTSSLGWMLLQRQQEEDHRRLFGAMAAICGAMCSAVAYVIVRKIGKQGAHSMQHVTYFGAVSCVISMLGLYTLQGGYVAPHGALMWTGVVSLGVAAFVGQILLNSGLQLAPLGPGTLMRMNDIVFAFIFQIAVQHEQPDTFSFIGASLVMICTGGMGLNKWRLEKKRSQQERKLLQEQEEPQPHQGEAAVQHA